MYYKFNIFMIKSIVHFYITQNIPNCTQKPFKLVYNNTYLTHNDLFLIYVHQTYQLFYYFLLQRYYVLYLIYTFQMFCILMGYSYTFLDYTATSRNVTEQLIVCLHYYCTDITVLASSLHYSHLFVIYALIALIAAHCPNATNPPVNNCNLIVLEITYKTIPKLLFCSQTFNILLILRFHLTILVRIPITVSRGWMVRNVS